MSLFSELLWICQSGWRNAFPCNKLALFTRPEWFCKVHFGEVLMSRRLGLVSHQIWLHLTYSPICSPRTFWRARLSSRTTLHNSHFLYEHQMLATFNMLLGLDYYSYFDSFVLNDIFNVEHTMEWPNPPIYRNRVVDENEPPGHSLPSISLRGPSQRSSHSPKHARIEAIDRG